MPHLAQPPPQLQYLLLPQHGLGMGEGSLALVQSLLELHHWQVLLSLCLSLCLCRWRYCWLRRWSYLSCTITSRINHIQSCSLFKKSTDISVPLCKTLLHLFWYNEINEPRAVISTLSRFRLTVSDTYTNPLMGEPVISPT